MATDGFSKFAGILSAALSRGHLLGFEKAQMEFGVRHSWISFIVPPLTSLVAQMVKRLPTIQETQVQSLGQEDLLEKEMATHSSILAWKIPWTEEPG